MILAVKILDNSIAFESCFIHHTADVKQHPIVSKVVPKRKAKMVWFFMLGNHVFRLCFFAPIAWKVK